MKNKELIKVTCKTCGKDVYKEARYVKQAEKRNQKNFFCSTRCALSFGREVIKEERKIEPKKYLNMSGLKTGSKTDEFSPFRAHLKRIRARNNISGIKTDLTLQDLKDVWERQRGTCPYTGWEMLLPKTVQEYYESGHLPNKASVDRKDPSKGYTKDNIEFVAMIANLSKNNWDRQTVIDFGRAVAKQHPLEQ